MKFESMPWHVLRQWDWWDLQERSQKQLWVKHHKFLVLLYCNWVLPNSSCASSVRAPKGWCCTTTSCLTSRPPNMAVAHGEALVFFVAFVVRFVPLVQVSSVRCVPMTHAIRVWWKWIVKVQAKTWWTAQQSAWYQKWALGFHRKNGEEWVLALIRS